jgi:alkyl hydroperoxide reductase subunit AhpC
VACHLQEIAARYGVLVKDKGVALRGLFIINPQGVLEQSTINNLPIGRSVDEALRLLQAIQFTAEHGEVRSSLVSSWASLVDLLELLLFSGSLFTV